LGRPFGELELSKALDKLREDLEGYFGALNELRYGLNVAVPEKPQSLTFFEQMEEFRSLPKAGGLLDQPFILMREMKLCVEVRDIFAAFARAQQKQPGG